MKTSTPVRTQSTNPIDLYIGKRLKARRELRRVSQDTLAKLLGISLGQLQDIEAGRIEIGAKTLLAAADVLNVHARYFFVDYRPAKPAPSWLREVDVWFRDEVTPHEGLFFTVAERLLRNREAARDLVHDAYATVIKGEQWRTVLNPKAYIAQIVSNLAKDQLRRNKVIAIEQYADIEPLGFTDDMPDAHQVMQSREDLRLVFEAVEILPVRSRQVFTMRRLEDIPPRKIAQALGLTIGSVEQHLIRAMVDIHKYLEKNRKAVQLKVWLANQAALKPAAKDSKDD